MRNLKVDFNLDKRFLNVVNIEKHKTPLFKQWTFEHNNLGKNAFWLLLSRENCPPIQCNIDPVTSKNALESVSKKSANLSYRPDLYQSILKRQLNLKNGTKS